MVDEYSIDKVRFLILYLDADKKPSHISRILDRWSKRTIRDRISKIEKEIDILEI